MINEQAYGGRSLGSILMAEKLMRVAAKKSFKHFVRYMKPDFKFSKFNLELIKALRSAYEGKITKLIVNMPPRHGKTLLINEMFPAWVLGNRPGEQFVNAGYALGLARTSSRKCFAIVTSKKFANVFPECKIGMAKADEWETIDNEMNSGWYYAVGIGGGLTGRWYTFGIIDDPVKNRDDAESPVFQEKVKNRYTSTFLTRKQASRKKLDKIVVIIVQTRWNTEDLTGYVTEMEKTGGEKFVKLVYPAMTDEGDPLFPERRSISDYERMRIDVGPRDREALYMRNPIASMGSIFTKNLYRYFLRSDFDNASVHMGSLKKEDCVRGIHVDPAFSTSKNSDDTVVMLVGMHRRTGEMYVRDISGGTISETIAFSNIFKMAMLAEREGIKISYVSIERVAINKNRTLFKTNFIEEMKRRVKFYTLLEFRPNDEKNGRIMGHLEGRFRRWTIHFLNKSDSGRSRPFVTLENRLGTFPHGSHDDYPDCLAQAAYMLSIRIRSVSGSPGTEEGRTGRVRREVFDPLTGRVVRR